MTRAPYPVEWSLAEVQLVGGAMLALHVAVTPKIADHLAQRMRDIGFLILRNDKESISIAADRVVAFRLTLIVGDQPT